MEKIKKILVIMVGCSLLTSCNSIINNDVEEVMRIDNVKQINDKMARYSVSYRGTDGGLHHLHFIDTLNAFQVSNEVRITKIKNN